MDIDTAIVLYNIDYKDNSKILYLYTKTGQKSVIAHGVKKLNNINRYLSQNGTEIKCSISSGSFPSLRDGELLEEYIHIKQDLIGYTYMNHIMELVRSTISDDLNHEKMYVFLQKLFRMMNNGYDPEILTFIFELKLMFFLGTGLHLQACSVCAKTEHLCFHISSGGLICKDHLEAFELVYDETVYREIQTLYYIDIEEDAFPIIDSNTRVIIRHIIDLLFSEFIGFSTKSREILKQIKKY